jgi:hypothetical protein
MGRLCSICTHPERPTIDRELAGGKGKREVSALFRVSEDAVTRHASGHLPARLVQAQAAEDVKQALDVVKQLQAINGATVQILTQARAVGDGGLALKAIDRIQRQLELQARLLGDLDDRPQINILISAEWADVRHVLLSALDPFPAARIAVAGALAGLDGPA